MSKDTYIVIVQQIIGQPVQALDRTQPGLPMKKGDCGTTIHDDKRRGTTSLFAALELAQGDVVGECHQRHRHQEFLSFLLRLDKEFPGRFSLHLVMDNYGTHKKEEVQVVSYFILCPPAPVG